MRTIRTAFLGSALAAATMSATPTVADVAMSGQSTRDLRDPTVRASYDSEVMSINNGLGQTGAGSSCNGHIDPGYTSPTDIAANSSDLGDTADRALLAGSNRGLDRVV